MKDKRFLKIARVNEERYFRNNQELISFIEKMNNTTWEDMINLLPNDSYYETRMNLKRDFLIIGKFIVAISRGNFIKTSGEYSINILSMQKTDNLTQLDIKQLFKL